MNSLTELVSDLDLSESSILLKLNSSWQADFKFTEDVPLEFCANAEAFVMKELLH